jgi:hypothetical protein
MTRVLLKIVLQPFMQSKLSTKWCDIDSYKFEAKQDGFVMDGCRNSLLWLLSQLLRRSFFREYVYHPEVLNPPYLFNSRYVSDNSEYVGEADKVPKPDIWDTNNLHNDLYLQSRNKSSGVTAQCIVWQCIWHHHMQPHSCRHGNVPSGL